MAVAVVSDTCHYLPRDVLDANGIQQVSLYVHERGEPQRELDITDYAAYYGRLADAGELPTTSQPSIGDFLAVYEPLLDADKEIVSIHLAGGMSGTVGAAEQARDQLGERRGDEDLSVVIGEAPAQQLLAVDILAEIDMPGLAAASGIEGRDARAGVDGEDAGH